MRPLELQKYKKYTVKPEPLFFPLHPRQDNYNFKPLGPLTSLPFKITRTNSGCIPVYYKYNSGYKNPKTVIRRIEGDITQLKEEISKIISNNKI